MEEPIGTPEKGVPPTRSEFNLMISILIGVSVVVAVCLVSLVMQSLNASQATFQDLKDQVVIQNARIDTLLLLEQNKQ